MNSNPLIAAYRKPALFVSLPSGGKFYEPVPKLSADGELAVYPMTARDELVSKTPDALFNGEATIALINSCCPDIPNPDQIPVSDLMVILIAIRIASYDKAIDVDINCPKCEQLNMLSIDANRIIAGVTPNATETHLTLPNDFVLDLRPYNLTDRTRLQIQQVKQQKLLQNLTSTDLDDEQRNKLFGETFVEIADLTVELILNCIASVTPPEGESISDRETINEWLKTINRSDYDLIRDRVEALSESGVNTTFTANCVECGHEWETDIELDMANFFEG